MDIMNAYHARNSAQICLAEKMMNVMTDETFRVGEAKTTASQQEISLSKENQ